MATIQPKMKEYVNFYENLEEAQARLNRTVVMYDGLPYYVVAITNHMPDKIFRMYLDPIGEDPHKANPNKAKIHNIATSHHANTPSLGIMLDQVFDTTNDHGILRKQMNSPLFNKFRPFPLGMCNRGTGVSYLERTPIRPSMLQGLSKQAIVETSIAAGADLSLPVKGAVNIMSAELKDCILGDHFTAHQALSNLKNPDALNDAVAFHREFALVLGPMDIIFLAYRTDIIGILPKNDFSECRLDKDFKYCKEVVQELNLFGWVSIN